MGAWQFLWIHYAKKISWTLFLSPWKINWRAQFPNFLFLVTKCFLFKEESYPEHFLELPHALVIPMFFRRNCITSMANNILLWSFKRPRQAYSNALVGSQLHKFTFPTEEANTHCTMANTTEEFAAEELTTSFLFESSPFGQMDTLHCRLFNLIVSGIIGALVTILGIVGNLLTIVIMAKDQKTSITSRLLMCLAVADNMALIAGGVYIPVEGIARFFPFTLKLARLPLLGPSSTALVWIFNQMSTSFIVLITWQRYLSVCAPTRVKSLCSSRKVNVLILLIIVLTIAEYMPYFFLTYFVKLPNGMYQLKYVALKNDPIFNLLYNTFLQSCTSYFFLFFVWRTWGWKLWKFSESSKVGSNRMKVLQKKKLKGAWPFLL